MRFSVLGPLEVNDDGGEPVDVGSSISTTNGSSSSPTSRRCTRCTPSSAGRCASSTTTATIQSSKSGDASSLAVDIGSMISDPLQG
jgi:hypothetical protein